MQRECARAGGRGRRPTATGRPWPAARARPVETDADEGGGEGLSADFDLEKELESVVGLHEVKEMLRGIRNGGRRKKRAGMGVNDDRTMHMLFLGNPGTGKTTAASSRACSALGLLKKGQPSRSRKVRLLRRVPCVLRVPRVPLLCAGCPVPPLARPQSPPPFPTMLRAHPPGGSWSSR